MSIQQTAEHRYSRHSRRPWECRHCGLCPCAHATIEHDSDRFMCVQTETAYTSHQRAEAQLVPLKPVDEITPELHLAALVDRNEAIIFDALARNGRVAKALAYAIRAIVNECVTADVDAIEVNDSNARQLLIDLTGREW